MSKSYSSLAEANHIIDIIQQNKNTIKELEKQNMSLLNDIGKLTFYEKDRKFTDKITNIINTIYPFRITKKVIMKSKLFHYIIDRCEEDEIDKLTEFFHLNCQVIKNDNDQDYIIHVTGLSRIYLSIEDDYFQFEDEDHFFQFEDDEVYACSFFEKIITENVNKVYEDSKFNNIGKELLIKFIILTKDYILHNYQLIIN